MPKRRRKVTMRKIVHRDESSWLVSSLKSVSLPNIASVVAAIVVAAWVVSGKIGDLAGALSLLDHKVLDVTQSLTEFKADTKEQLAAQHQDTTERIQDVKAQFQPIWNAIANKKEKAPK